MHPFKARLWRTIAPALGVASLCAAATPPPASDPDALNALAVAVRTLASERAGFTAFHRRVNAQQRAPGHNASLDVQALESARKVKDEWVMDLAEIFRTVDMIVATLLANADKAKALVKAAVPLIAGDAARCPQGCDHALDHALITAPEKRDPKLLKKLDAVAGRVLRPAAKGKKRKA